MTRRAPSASNRVVQSLWIGAALSTLERLSIQSFLANGHEFHLYCFGTPVGVPRGTVLRQAADVLPEGRVFGYGEGFAKGSPAAFSNLFRYKLLLEHGGWWVDTDVVCLRPFELPDVRLWGSERMDPPQELTVSTSVIKAPPGDALMQWAWHACEQIDTSAVQFGQIGPRLLQKGVDALGLHAWMRPHTFFSPIAFYDWHTVLESGRSFHFGGEVLGIHLWNQMWNAHGVDKDAAFPGDCLFESLKQRYGVSAA